VLSDREQEMLDEIQRRAVAEDPDFARSFEDIGRAGDSHFSLQWAHEMPRWVYTAAVLVSAAFSVLMLLALAPWPALVFMLLALLIAAARARRQDEVGRTSVRRSETDRPAGGHRHQS
jgi:hypothetical protein